MLNPHIFRAYDVRGRVGVDLDAAVFERVGRAYATLIRIGYQIDFTMVRMQHGKPEDYEDASQLVLDDWR